MIRKIGPQYRVSVRMQIHAPGDAAGVAMICDLTDVTIAWVQSGFISNFEYIKWWERYVLHYASYTGGDYADTEDCVVTYL